MRELTEQHEWLEIGARRWCLACGSFQVRSGDRWHDAIVGPYPGYNRTDPQHHREDISLPHQLPLV